MSDVMTENLDTPMMRQFLEVKRRYPNEILFFRMGDFYEMFLEDAIYASRVLDIALTKRQDKVPMCGVPYHSAHNYIHRLLQSGRNIAVCEQIEDPKTVTGRIVSRDVVRILTPGSLYEEELLDKNERRMLCALHEDVAAAADLSTGEIYLDHIAKDNFDGYLSSRSIKELIYTKRPATVPQGLPCSERPLPRQSRELIGRFLKTANIDSLELSDSETAALALLFQYVAEISPRSAIEFRRPVREKRERMLLDEATLKTLEILQDQNGSRKASLAGIIDRTRTAAGRRLLNDWLTRPSVCLAEIKFRHEAVEFFQRQNHLADYLRESLNTTHDLARLMQQLRLSPQVKHLGQIQSTLNAIYDITSALVRLGDLPAILKPWIDGSLAYPSELRDELNRALLSENLPPLLDERRFVRAGYSPPLDELFHLAESAQNILRDFEENEKKKYEISTLKIRYNRVLGYYFEISKGQSDKAPAHYIRRQTLTTGERFTSEELQNLESRLLNAHDEVIRLQKAIFDSLCLQILKHCEILHRWGDVLAQIDVLLSFAEVASAYNYVRPEMHERPERELILVESRHPVVEQIFREEFFVPNDVHLNCKNAHLAILTGPNMAGKSTYIRQIGLAVILAQAGCFVPAKSAILPVTDRVFTRIGAYDRLFKGESTFYVEMAECARIFANFTPASLILLDEVGRGTSTYDGISIARAMIEYLNAEEYGRPKTLFATHYAELARLIEPQRGILGLTVSVQEHAGKIVFLRKIIPGSANKSYGIHVAELAGMPAAVIDRARALLKELEEEGLWRAEPVFREIHRARKQETDTDQLSFFD